VLRGGGALLLALGPAGPSATYAGGLEGAIEGQRQELKGQQGEARRQVERREDELRRQQEPALGRELAGRDRPPAPLPRPLICTRVGDTLFCQ
jgi:hypothetical protein